MLNSLRNLKQRDWAIIAIILTVLAGVAWWYFIYQPTLDRIAVLEDEIARLETEVARGEAAQRNLPALRETVARLEVDRRRFLSEIPNERDLAILFSSLRSNAEATGVTFSEYTSPSVDEGDIDNVQELTFDFTTTGTYTETVAFLQLLENLQRFTQIEAVDLSLDNDLNAGDPEISANYTFRVFVYTGDDPGESETL
ncbi:MAG: type 4a pilus biogenesis protein PilO [Deinococcota bacterium]